MFAPPHKARQKPDAAAAAAGSLGVKPLQTSLDNRPRLSFERDKEVRRLAFSCSHLQLVAQLLHLVGLLGLDVRVEFPERGGRHAERRATVKLLAGGTVSEDTVRR